MRWNLDDSDDPVNAEYPHALERQCSLIPKSLVSINGQAEHGLSFSCCTFPNVGYIAPIFTVLWTLAVPCYSSSSMTLRLKKPCMDLPAALPTSGSSSPCVMLATSRMFSVSSTMFLMFFGVTPGTTASIS